MPLKILKCADSPRISDLEPLRGMPLEEFHCGNTAVGDLEPLSGMPLRVLLGYNTSIADLSPLRGMQIEVEGVRG